MKAIQGWILVFRRKELLSIDNLPVLSALEGVVSTVLIERLPYGHAVIIETPIESISPNYLRGFNFLSNNRSSNRIQNSIVLRRKRQKPMKPIQDQFISFMRI